MTTSPLPPGSTIGILGGGQLGRMLALAAARLGLKSRIYSDVAGPAFDVSLGGVVGTYEDTDKISAFAKTVDVVTYEFENVPLSAAAAAGLHVPVRPGPKALAVSQDRLSEKTFVRELGIAVAPFAAVDSPSCFDAAIKATGEKAILKTRRLGYDGKGQARIASAAELPRAFDEIGRAPAVLEGFVPFELEVSVLVVRSLTGEVRFYDIPVNTHKHGILDTSRVPSGLPQTTLRRPATLPARSPRRSIMWACSPLRCSILAATPKTPSSSMKWPPAFTIQATGRRMPARSASSKTTCAPLQAGLWAPPSGIRMRS